MQTYKLFTESYVTETFAKIAMTVFWLFSKHNLNDKENSISSLYHLSVKQK